jgi:YidC/Oxa1 family membrane protein insertase
MENRRLILFMVLAFSLFMLWNAWLTRNQPAPVAGAPAPQAQQPSATPTPSASMAAPAAPGGAATPASKTAPRVVVRTDALVAEISSQGGDIVRLELLGHKGGADGAPNFVLFDDGGQHVYAAQSGLIGPNLPTHKTEFRLPGAEAVLKEGENSLTLRLEAPEHSGVKVAKLFTFHRDSYQVDVAYEITNQSDAPVAAHAYYQLARDGKPAETVQAFGVHTFTGPAFYTDAQKFQKVAFEDIAADKAKHAKEASDGWVAMVQHYFVSAWLPEGDVKREFYTRKLGDDLYAAGVIVPVPTLAPGQTGSVTMDLYAGPQEQDKLESVAKGLDLVVDYGWLTVIAAPLFWVLQWFHKLTGNWGWAIILVTIAIKALFFPLSAASYKSMAKMRTLGPRLQQLKERYGDDKMKMQQAMMEIYKTEKVNPLGGCLPMVVQIPVFIALYWVLLGSVEMRHAPWLGWIQDLSAKDPYYILPIIMGVTMLIQTKLNPTPPDPMQAKIMMLMPIIFSVMFLWFPAGLVLYWVVNNTLSIAQQWQITRMIESGKAKPA